MTPTNRPITSREYKLMLNTERFRDRRAGAGLFWKLLTFLVENQGNEVISDQVDRLEKDAEKIRTTWYLDTPGYELQRANITLRVREEPSAKSPFKVTLKFRAPDRYTAAGCDVRCSQEVADDDLKFEEDVVPPFVSKFSYSVSFKSKELPAIKTMGDAVDIFPGLAAYDFPGKTPLRWSTASGRTRWRTSSGSSSWTKCRPSATCGQCPTSWSRWRSTTGTCGQTRTTTPW